MYHKRKPNKVRDSFDYPVWKKAYDMFYQARHRAIQKGLPFDLDVEWLCGRLVNKCEVTGLSFEYPKGRRKRTKLSPSVDRIDNELGYTKDNCRLVIWWFNSAKGTLSDISVWHLCALIVNSLDVKLAHTVRNKGAITPKTT